MARIRDATAEDVSRIREVALASWQAAYAGFLTPPQCQQAIDRLYPSDGIAEAIEELQGYTLVLAEADGVVQGFAAAEPTWADEAELYSLYVHPDRWDEGLGGALLERIRTGFEPAVERVACSVFVENYGGVGFLEYNGFERTGRTRTQVAGAIHEEIELECALGE
jgi:N-acetylglutamate synthase-like GNAT family acetyltransferase